MILELSLIEPVTEEKRNFDQLAMMPETISIKIDKGLGEMFEETLAWQMRKYRN